MKTHRIAQSTETSASASAAAPKNDGAISPLAPVAIDQKAASPVPATLLGVVAGMPFAALPAVPTRPGITPATLAKLRIFKVTKAEATRLAGKCGAGIAIPYPRVKGKDGPFYRIRLENVVLAANGKKKKYHQRFGSSAHLYIPEDYSLFGGWVVIIEGEFKAISLGESGVPAIGSSGFYGAFAGCKVSESDPYPVEDENLTELNPELIEIIQTLKPLGIYLVGDSDTGLNYQFSDAAAKLAERSGLPVRLPRIPYHQPNGKGIDDVREKLGDESFAKWRASIFEQAIEVRTGENAGELALRLLQAEGENLLKLENGEKSEARKRVARLACALPEWDRGEVAKIAKSAFGWTTAEFNRACKAAKSEQARTPTATPTSPLTILADYAVVGTQYFGKTIDPVTKVRSEIMVATDVDNVSRALIAAGFDDSDNDIVYPGLGCPEMTRLEAALLYLGETRCAAFAGRFFKPYGPSPDKNGTRVFNNRYSRLPQPAGNIVTWKDPSLRFTGTWLTALLGEEQLDHLTCILSYVYSNALKGVARKTLAPLLVGNIGVGKGLFIDYFLTHLFGEKTASGAERLFAGEMGASTALDSFVVNLSDAGLGDGRNAGAVRSGILALLSNHTHTARRLYQDACTEVVENLFAFSSNPDGEVIKMFRDASGTILGKIAGYSCGDGLLALKDTFSDEVLSMPSLSIESELPAVCSLLVNWAKSGIAAQYKESRFGVRPYWSPHINPAIGFTNEEKTVIEALAHFESCKYAYSTAIYNALSKDQLAIAKLPPDRFRKILITLAAAKPEIVSMKKYSHSETFKIVKPTAAVIAALASPSGPVTAGQLP